MTNQLESNDRNRIDDFCFWAIVIDVFFIPYFTYISVNCSLPIIIIWYCARGKNTHNCWEYKYFILALIFMIISTLINPFYPDSLRWETSFLTSIKRLFQYITSIWYFLFFRYYILRYKINISRLVAAGITFIFIISIFYFINPMTYATFKNSIYPADNHTARWLSGTIYSYRYNFFWADPNNVAYCVVSLLSFYLVENTNKIAFKYVIFVMTIFILFCTMSNGGFIMLFVVCILYIIHSIFNSGRNKIKLKTISINALLLFCIVILAFILSNQIMAFLDSSIVSQYMVRLNSYVDTGNLSGGRLADLEESIELLSPLFLFIGSGKEGFTSENGHIYLISMYGFFVYLYYMTVMFGKRKKIYLYKYITFLPLLVGFTMNIAIIEQKFLLILLLLSAYYSAESFAFCQKKVDFNI